MAEALYNKKTTVKALRVHLLIGVPDSFCQIRQQVVFALAKLGARSVLLEYLRKPLKIADPVVRAAEEAVQGSAARELLRWKDNRTFSFLMEFTQKYRRTGALEALSEFERIETIPIFIATLEDDFYRPAAEKGLRRLGNAAKPHLIRSALTPVLKDGYEPPRSVRRRQSALSILADANISHKDWKTICALLRDLHPEIVAGISALAATFALTKDRSYAARRIIATYSTAAVDWRTIINFEECLLRLQPESAVAIDHALKQRIFQNNPKVAEHLHRIRSKMRS